MHVTANGILPASCPKPCSMKRVYPVCPTIPTRLHFIPSNLSFTIQHFRWSRTGRCREGRSAVREEASTSIHIMVTHRGTCRMVCNGIGGHWSTEDYSCHVTGYLSRICIRVRKGGMNDTEWVVDTPPYMEVGMLRCSYQKLSGGTVEEGCEYRDERNLLRYKHDHKWLPFVYTVQPPSSLHIAACDFSLC